MCLSLEEGLTDGRDSFAHSLRLPQTNSCSGLRPPFPMPGTPNASPVAAFGAHNSVPSPTLECEGQPVSFWPRQGSQCVSRHGLRCQARSPARLLPLHYVQRTANHRCTQEPLGRRGGTVAPQRLHNPQDSCCPDTSHPPNSHVSWGRKSYMKAAARLPL